VEKTVTQNFWLVTIPRNQRLLVQAASPTPMIEVTPCPLTDRHSGRIKYIGTLHVEADPRAVRDFTWTWMTELLISSKVLKVFEKHHVTGFDLRPVIAKYPKPSKAPFPQLHEVMITGWAGLPSREAKLMVTEFCPACHRTVYSIGEPSKLLDASSWDGSDLFMVWPAPRHFFASDRLASIIRQEKLGGVKLIPPAAIDMDRGTTLNPGSLFQWLPEERAEELSQQLGIR
jgi:hypothetical protein